MSEVRNPRPAGKWVDDEADVISPADEAALERLLGQLHADTTAEVAVVTVHDTDQEPKPFASALFNTWHVGDKTANNGLLVLLVVDRRRLEMETGYGLEGTLPDGWLGQMQAQRMVPRFKAGDLSGGMVAGLRAIDERLRGNAAEVALGTAGEMPVGGAPSVHRETRPTSSAPALAIGGGSAVFAIGATLGFVRHRRRKERTCEACDLYMPMLSEAEEDQHLDAGQQAEERVGSIDWEVHQCPKCGTVRSFANARWFSGFSHCPSCARKTRTTSRTTLIPATQLSGGLERIRERCAHCHFHNEYTRSTPRLPPPSSHSSSSGGSSFGGSSGGGGSFGGGSSGGGGAGSSW